MILSGIAAVGVLGGAVGYGARRLAGSAGNLPAASANTTRSSASVGGQEASGETGGPRGRSGAKLPEIPHHKSEDTIASLLAGDPATSYGRTAAWLADAGEGEIAAFWTAYQGGKRTNDMTDLVFLNWTRADPEKATAAVAGTKDEHYAWWAWAAHDPKRALAEASARNPDRLNNVTWGIGEFHPEWLRENFEKLPEDARGNAIGGMQKWPDRQDPEGSLDFMLKHDMGFERETFLSLVRKDPWAAQDWLERNPSVAGNQYSDDGTVVDMMMATLARERPEDLQRMVETTAPGESRRKMEQVLYEQLVTQDAEAALELARKGDAPMLKVQQLAQVGLKLMGEDPERAFALGAEMLETGGGKLGYESRVEYENGMSSGSRPGKGDELMNTLFDKDPARTMDLIGASGQDPQAHVFQNLMSRWGQEDLAGLTAWANKQTRDETRYAAASQITGQLTQLGEYAEALEWAAAVQPSHRGHVISNTAQQWANNDPEAIREWLESAALPEDQRQQILKGIENARKNGGNW
ncbi:MAG: hypothetical protein EOP87_08135 [Verrucomicrobiaceae bacterium]|nr:MAG: hypothetical protein EOP87_08135 [Verrucomicrobiaceae bacterium]